MGNSADIRTTIRGGEEASTEVEQESGGVENKGGMDAVKPILRKGLKYKHGRCIILQNQYYGGQYVQYRNMR